MSRPKADEMYNHPLFWEPHTRLDFFRDVSSRLKLDSSKYSDFWTSLKNLEHYKDWLKKGKLGKIVKGYIEDEQGVHCYDVISLIRVIRNIYDHYGDVPAQVAKELGEILRGYDNFFQRGFKHCSWMFTMCSKYLIPKES